MGTQARKGGGMRSFMGSGSGGGGQADWLGTRTSDCFVDTTLQHECVSFKQASRMNLLGLTAPVKTVREVGRIAEQ